MMAEYSDSKLFPCKITTIATGETTIVSAEEVRADFWDTFWQLENHKKKECSPNPDDYPDHKRIGPEKFASKSLLFAKIDEKRHCKLCTKKFKPAYGLSFYCRKCDQHEKLLRGKVYDYYNRTEGI